MPPSGVRSAWLNATVSASAVDEAVLVWVATPQLKGNVLPLGAESSTQYPLTDLLVSGLPLRSASL